MKFTDTHIHLQDYNEEKLKTIINAARQAGVKRMICCGTAPANWKKVSDLAQSYPDEIVPAFGLHPWHIGETAADWEEQLEYWLRQYPEALIGECGLDGIKDKQPEPQCSVFQKHIELAEKYRRPLIIHAVRCWGMMEKFWNILPEKFVFHSFNASTEILKKIIKCGGYVSFSFSILKNKERQKVISTVPAEKILTETDGPYQAEEKGIINLPERLPGLIEILAGDRGNSPEEFARQLEQNVKEFIYGR